MKKTIQLKESDITRMVMEAVNELDWKTYQNAAKKSHLRAVDDLSGEESRKESRRGQQFRRAAENAFNRDYGTDDTKLHSDMIGGNSTPPGGGHFPYYDDSYIRMSKNGDTYQTYNPIHYNDFKWAYDYNSSKYRDEWDKATDELENYKKGNYEYIPGEGWAKKNESIVREAVNRTLRKYIR